MVCAGWLGKMDKIILQCRVPASCTLPSAVIHGIGKSKQQEQMLLLGPAEETWS